MNRLERCKLRIQEKQASQSDAHELELLYQELMNYLPTYKEKKALSLYYAQLKKQLVLS